MLYNENPRNAREAIFSVLLESGTKKPAELWREIEYLGIKITIQGIVKALKGMEKEGIIIRNKEGISVNPRYITKLRKTLEKYESIILQPAKITKIARTVEIHTVNSLLEQDTLWAKISKDWIKNNPKDKTKAWIGRHCWWFLFRLEHEDEYHDFMTNHGVKTFNLLTKNTALDKTAANYYNKKGIKSKIMPKLDMKNIYIESFGNFYMKCEIPEEISTSLEKIYNKTKNIEDIEMKEITDIMKKKIPINVIVIKDASEATKIRQSILNNF